MESESTTAPPGDNANKSDASTKTGGKKLDKLLDRLHDTANGSRENSPDPSKSKEKSSGSSRRKPKVTRKVTEDDKAPAVEIQSSVDTFETNSFDYIDSLLGSAREPSPEPEPLPEIDNKQNGDNEPMQVDDDDAPQVIEDSNNESFVIPEGTVVVQPEAVEEKRPTFKGPEWKQTKKTSRGEALGSVLCTACNKQINTNKEGSAKRHPVLKVLICKKCYNWYTSAEIEQDEDGMDEQCRWCGEGGNLICCDFCHNAFCKTCIKRNLGRKEMSQILDAGDDVKWKCYVCDPKPMAKLIQEATDIISEIERTAKENKQKESQKRMPARTPKSSSSSVKSPAANVSTANFKQTARKSTTPQPPGRSVQIQNIVKNVHNSLSNTMPIITSVQGATPVYMIPNQGGNKNAPQGRVIGQFTMQQKIQPKPHIQPQTNKPATIVHSNVSNLQGKNNRPGSSPGRVGEWDVNVNEFNVCQVLDRTLAATESMRMVLSSFKEELKKGQRSGHAPFVNSKRDVSRKLRRAMGAFKKQIADIETFTRAFQVSRVSTSPRSKPQPLGLVRHNSPSVQTVKKTPQKGGDVVVILSDSDEEEDSSKSKDSAKEISSEKKLPEKKAFSMKLKLGSDNDKENNEETENISDEELEESKSEEGEKKSETGGEEKKPESDKEVASKDGTAELPQNISTEDDEVMLLDISMEEAATKEKDSSATQGDEKVASDKDEIAKPSDIKDSSDKNKIEENVADKSENMDTDDVPDDKEVDKDKFEENDELDESVTIVETDKAEEKEKEVDKHKGTAVDEDKVNDKKVGKDAEKVVDSEKENDKVERSESDVVSKEVEESSKPQSDDENKEEATSPCKEDEEKSIEETSDNNEGNEVSDTEFQAILSEVTAAITSQIESSDCGAQSDAADHSAVEEAGQDNDEQKEDATEENKSDGFESIQHEPLFDAGIDSDKETSKRRRSKDVDEADDSEEPGPSKRSRATADTQLQLHKQQIETGSSDDSDDEDSSSDPVDSDKKSSSGDEYCPKSDLKSLKHDKKVDRDSVRKKRRKQKDKIIKGKKLSRIRVKNVDHLDGSDSESDDSTTARRQKRRSHGKEKHKQHTAKDKKTSDSSDKDSKKLKREKIEKKRNEEVVSPDKSDRESKIKESTSDISDKDSKKVKREKMEKKTKKDVDTSDESDRESRIKESASDISDEGSKKVQREKMEKKRKKDVDTSDESDQESKLKESEDEQKEEITSENEKSKEAEVLSKVEVVMDVDGVGEKDLECENSDKPKAKRSRKFSKCGSDSKDKKDDSQESELDTEEREKIFKRRKQRRKDLQKKLSDDSKLQDQPVVRLPRVEERYCHILSDKSVVLKREDLKSEKKPKKKYESSDSESMARGKKTDKPEKIKRSKHKKHKNPNQKQEASDSSDVELLFESIKVKSRKSSKRKKEDLSESRKSNKTSDSDKKKTKRARKEDDSSSLSDDLDKEFEKLKKMPKIGKGIQKDSDDDSDSDDSDLDFKKAKKELSPRQLKAAMDRRTIGKPGYKKKSRKSAIDDLSSGREEDEEMPEEEDERDKDDSPVKRRTDGAEKGDENERARKALLADESTTSDGDVSGLEGIGEKEKRERRENGKENGVDSDDDMATDSSLSKKKKSKTPALLKTKLDDDDDDDSDFVSLKSKKKKTEDSGSDVSLKDLDDLSSGTDQKDSDSDIGAKKKKGKRKKSNSSSHSSSGSSEESSSELDSDGNKKKKKGKKGKGKKRKRIKKMANSSDSEAENNSDDEDEDGKKHGRKDIRKIIKDKKLSKEAKTALKAEEERRSRIKERQKQYNQVDVVDENSPMKSKMTTKLVLDWDKEKKPLLEVHPKLIKKLKPHQVEAVKFLFDSTIESLSRLKKDAGGGCILAHCMGLGKTLSVIAFTHTMLFNDDKTKMTTALVVCPLNTVLNWQNEWTKWLDAEEQLDVYELSSVKNNLARADALKDWHENGGIMILGYEMYRNLTLQKNIKNKRQKKIFTEALVDPGPDLVICDEGHVLKNSQSSLSKAMGLIKTRRRVVLTGTPLQNNLIEYHCMVDFVKPSLLGTKKEFMNRFVNPILNGQHSDSSHHDVKIMKKRAHILHEHLAGCVQRKDYTELTKVLMAKHEYVISVRLSKKQQQLYDKYMERLGDIQKGKGGQLFSDYQALMRIWTHPWVLKLDEIRQENKRMLKDEEDDFLDDDEYDSEDSFINNTNSDSESKSDKSEITLDSLSSDDDGARRSKRQARRRRSRGGDSDKESERSKKDKKKRRTRRNDPDSESEVEEIKETYVTNEWWGDFVKDEDQFDHLLSGKLILLAQILKMCENIGDKLLVFSQSLLSLDLIERFLEKWDEEPDPDKRVAGQQKWFKNMDYFRMDGSTSAQYRRQWCNEFNDNDNIRARLFLISTRAGSLGTNLVSANRVIIFDASWNPSHDVQSIFRVYRFGQTKPCYIYRFLAQGTMEEKIYERQVTKQSLSQRVVDEHQIDRHFSANDLQELYNFQPLRWTEENENREMPVLPKDRLLAELLTDRKDWIVKYHEHDSLLENKVDEDLTEEERKKAWEEYEAEKKGVYTAARATYSNYRMNTQASSTQHWLDYYGVQQQQQQLQQAMPQPSMSLQNIEQVARAIYAANPGINQEQLQLKVQNYIEMVQAQQQMYFRQQQEERMAHERMKMAQMEAQSRERMAAYRNLAQSAAAAQGSSQNGQASASSALASMLLQGNKETKK